MKPNIKGLGNKIFIMIHGRMMIKVSDITSNLGHCTEAQVFDIYCKGGRGGTVY